jgi:hypothetical protein
MREICTLACASSSVGSPSSSMLVFFSLTYRNLHRHVALGLGINSALKLMLRRHGRWYAACGFQIDHDAVLREDQVEVADHRDRPALALGGDADLFLRMLFVFRELRLAELHQLFDGELRHRLDAPALGAGLFVADRKALVELFKCLVDRGCLAVAHQDLHDCVFAQQMPSARGLVPIGVLRPNKYDTTQTSAWAIGRSAASRDAQALSCSARVLFSFSFKASMFKF